MISRTPFKRLIAVLLGTVFSFLIVGGPLMTFTAQAGLPVTVLENVPDQTNQVIDEILHALAQAAVVAFFNAARTFAGQIAYDAANYIANGGTGQSALAFNQGFGRYLEHVASDTAGEFIGSLSDNFFTGDRAGFNLCRPPTPNQLLNLQISISNAIPGLDSTATTRPRPRCDFQQVIQSYQSVYTTLSNAQVSNFVTASFSTNGSGLGISGTILGRSVSQIQGEVDKATKDRTEGGGFKSVTDKVSGDIKTPATTVKAQTEEELVKKPSQSESDAFLATMGTAFEQGFSQLASYTASLFINTLANKLLQRIMERGIIGAFDFSTQSTLQGYTSPDLIFSRSTNDTRKANIDLKTVSLLRVSEVEISGELIACPENRGLWNCTADQNLAQLIQGKTKEGNETIRKAIDDGLLKGEWRLIPVTSVRENQDRNCYNYAYCAGNLQKLRAMRILPAGFEFAANSQVNIDRCAGAGGCVTLNEVVEAFSNCNDDNQRDATHPWCRLIDPNWVITSFQQQCQLSGFGETLISDRLGQRREECRDIQTCLQRNDRGDCVGGYGYCVADKSVYRFNADECPAVFASCRNFASRTGGAVSYLRNTLDYSVCSADNVGCLSYATNRKVTGEWMSTGTLPGATAPGQIFFDKTLETCGASDEGCTHLLDSELGKPSLNFIQNASFESLSSAGSELDRWTRSTAGVYAPPVVLTGSPSLDGTVASDPANHFKQDVDMIRAHLYTISAWIRANGAGPNATIGVRQYSSAPGAARVESPAAELSIVFRSSGCDLTPGVNQPRINTSGRTIDNTWQRLECSFLAASSTRYATIEIDGSGTLVDAVQLEEGQFATDFIQGTNQSLASLYMKVAPDDFRCTGSASDPSVCNNYAKVCRQVDAGCQGYTDTQGGPEVPAILTANDICPQECVGYAEFRKQPTAFDLVNDPDARFSDPTDATSVYFIPPSARQCTQENVGCAAFTNVAAAAAGGEQSTFWSYLRTCRRPDAALSKTFFTWEGSETAGFQLRTFSLISETGVSPAGPETLPKRGLDGSFKEPGSCNEALWRSGIDPDCRQFYDRDGQVYYRFYSQTILSTDDCTNLRISRSTGRDDCAKTGGDYNTVSGECIYSAFLGESRSCPATAADCRAYAGPAAGNVQVTLNESFRTGRGPFSAGTVSTESLLVGDSSLRLNEAAPVTSASFPSVTDGLYRVSFWAKAAGRNDLTLGFGMRDSAAPSAVPTQVGRVALSTDWQRYTVGLFGSASNVSSTLVITMSGPLVPRAVFIDEIRIERIRDTAYVIKDTWNTPAICDRSFSGVPEPQAMLGCRTYQDRFEREVNAFRFTRLCRAEGIGCRAFVDTRNSDSSYSETFPLNDSPRVPVYNLPEARPPISSDFFPGTTTTRAGDRMLYLVYDPSKVCKRENASCRAFGKPSYAPDHSTIAGYTTVYFKDDITKYGDALCRPSENFCEEFSFNGAKDYFRDPQNKVCEYKQGIRLKHEDFPLAPAGSILATLPEAEYDGWFIIGDTSSTPCYPDALQNGRTFPMPTRGDTVYTGWSASCPTVVGECTEFRDVNDTSDVLHRTGKPYFYINNDRLDKKSCNGTVDVANGCVLMRDQNDPVLSYSVAASYRKYSDNDFRPTAAINCFTTPSDPACIAAGHSSTTDANVLLKVKIDRDCAQWLGCKSSETVFDQATSRYKEICTNVALCDAGTNKPGDIFCGNYVDRAATSTELVMQKGKFFDINAYTSRPVGLGQKDYSGYAIPESFQITDLVTAKVGADGANNVDQNKYRFALDYRLATVVPIPMIPRPGTPGIYIVSSVFSQNEAKPLGGTPVGSANPSLRLCQHQSTGIIGYYISTDLPDSGLSRFPSVNCYLPVKSGGDNYNFQNISTRFTLDDPRTDATLTNAFPPAECRADPEADSPFPASFVTEWDLTKNPPKVVTKVGGFNNANTCEFGEDCACSYKRADYGSAAISKFFAPLSSGVPAGICQGGPRDGQTCLPSTIFQVGTQGTRTSTDPANVQTQAIQGAEGANASQTCGPAESGGHCIAFTKLEIIRGVFGQCLERDETRTLGDDQSTKPCLTWNPTPVLFGDKDSFHYQPTSGYMPPQNSGQYYCTSPVKKPAHTNLVWNSFSLFDSPHAQGTTGDGTHEVNTPDMYYAGDDDWDHASASDIFGGNRRGRLQFYTGWMDKIDYNDDWVSGDNNGVLGEDQNYFASIYGVTPASYYTATADCELADDDQQGSAGSTDSNGSTSNDFNAVRLIDAGSGYGEYFLRINDQNLTNALGISGLPAAVAAGGYVVQPSTNDNRGSFLDEHLSDNVISYFRISPIDNGAAGRIACGYQAAWVDGIGTVNYDDAGSNRQADSEWRRKFFEHYNSFLTRGQESVFASKSGTPYQVDCVGSGNPEDHLTKCYVKYWELNYRSENQKKFYGLQRLGPDGLPTDTIVRSLLEIRKEPIQSSCSESKPYFAVRAVFESAASRTIPPSLTPFTANDVQGPWRFVGFWVSACGGETGGDQRYIYMNVDVGTASVCKELAEVRSRDSNQDAAFTDRVWSKGDFREPGTGIQYSDNASPFSSAINTGPAGKDPLFQSGAEITGFSPLNPPTWLAPPSRTYTRNNPIPKDNWAMLSNLFARIYRVYRFQFLPVNKTDRICMVGPFQGTRCTPSPGTSTATSTCGIDGECDVLQTAPAGFKQCSFNISEGVECSEIPDICKVPTFPRIDGTTRSVANGCAPRVGWSETRPGFWHRSTDPVGTDYSTELAGRPALNAFGCQNNIGNNVEGSNSLEPDASARACGAPEALSFDCPVQLNGSCVNMNPDYGHCSFTDAQDRSALALAGVSAHESEVPCRAIDGCRFTIVSIAAGSCSSVGSIGKCTGGVRDGATCNRPFGFDTADVEEPPSGTQASCKLSLSDTVKNAAKNSCLLVSDTDGSPTTLCAKPGQAAIVTTEPNPDKDNNLCTNSGGYQPRTDMCPEPNDEFCGLIAYQQNDRPPTTRDQSVDPFGQYPLPTDNTLGMYTPTRLGYTTSSVSAATFRYMAYYNPGPPRLAAPNTANCPTPGQCEVSSIDRFDFNGQTEGAINVGGGTHKSTLRFYAWADPNQMPLRQTIVDWGDGQKQRLDDTRLKNRKPFCGVQRECSGVPGLTCETDADCAAGLGQCVTVGYCAQNQNLACHTNADCSSGSGVADTCTIRTRFGNSSDACQVGYFDFSHLYSCGAQQTQSVFDGGLQRCDNTFHCSRDQNRTCTVAGSSAGCAPGDICIENLAPVGGCFDETLRQCRFTPRVMLQDNWGWCTGECRASVTGGFPDDITTGASAVAVRHPNGGCWSGSTLGAANQNIRLNTRATGANGVPGNVVLPNSECNENFPSASGVERNMRPWIVYPGSLQLRESGELAP